MPDAPTCSQTDCVWELREATDAYSFILQRDSAVAGGVLQVEVQSAQGQDGQALSWAARIVDPGRIVLVDFYAGAARVWTGGSIALQASLDAPHQVSLNPSAISNLQSQAAFDAQDPRPKVRIRQVFVPALALTRMDAPTDAEVAVLGDDLSAIARVKFSEPVTGIEAADFQPTQMSTGCRVDELVDAGDHVNFEVRVRGCTAPWASLRLPANAVIGNAPGPAQDAYIGPMQPRLLAAAQVPQPSASPTAAPSVAATAAPTVEQVVEPAPVVIPPVVPVEPAAPVVPVTPVETQAPVPVVESELPPVANRVVQEFALKPDPKPVSPPATQTLPMPAATHSATYTTQPKPAETVGTPEPKVWPLQWLAAASTGLATVLAGVGATIAARKLRGRARVRVRLS
jgi:hypothetical protein